MRLLFLAVLRPHTGNAITAERLRYVAGPEHPSPGDTGLGREPELRVHKRLGHGRRCRAGTASFNPAAATLSGYCECPRVRKRGSLGQRWLGWGKTQRLRKGLSAEMGFGQTGLGYEGGTHVAGEKQSPGER